jgi:hypothetical protein
MACSLGGPHAVVEVLQALPASFPAAVAVVQHLSRRGGDILPRPFQSRMPLPIEWGHTGEPLRPGHVYLAPSDRHMLVTSDGCIQLTRSVPVGHCRPAADPLFASGAAAYHHRTLGVVLSGCCCDGAIGVQAIKWSGHDDRAGPGELHGFRDAPGRHRDRVCGPGPPAPRHRTGRRGYGHVTRSGRFPRRSPSGGVSRVATATLRSPSVTALPASP